MVSNIASRNIYLILAVSSIAGLVYCIYNTITTKGKWFELIIIALVATNFTKLYLTFRKKVYEEKHG